MSYAVIISPQAEMDILYAASWYETQQNGLGKSFTQDFRSKLPLLKTNPLQFSKKSKSVHVSWMNTFPYGIYFIIIENSIFIIAVLHSKRNPKLWKQRFKK